VKGEIWFTKINSKNNTPVTHGKTSTTDSDLTWSYNVSKKKLSWCSFFFCKSVHFFVAENLSIKFCVSHFCRIIFSFRLSFCCFFRKYFKFIILFIIRINLFLFAKFTITVESPNI
jgi:hypothetical protein